MIELETYPASKTPNGIPYKELRVILEEGLSISFRQYPKNVWVAIEDDRDCPEEYDIDDIFITSTRIVQKVSRYIFAFELSLSRIANSTGVSFSPQEIKELSIAWEKLIYDK